MSLIPNTTCPRCHRKYPSVRFRCPYCGTKKPSTVERTIPEADSAVKGTEAAHKTSENINWQMLIGGILLLCVIIAVIAMISVNVKSHVTETETAQAQAQAQAEAAAAATSIPTPTAVPTPSPTPTPSITQLNITYAGNDMTGFMEGTGTEVQLAYTAYPLGIDVEVTWSSSDDTVATVSEDGLVTVTGAGYCTVTLTAANGITDTCDVWGY